LREYFPKETNSNEVSDSAVAKAIKLLNDRPRKMLDFKTPAYLTQQQMTALAA
jgi:IS30 family transposase